LDETISPTQNAFIPGRMIIDNAVIGFKCSLAMQNNSNSVEKFCAYKLGLTKAYGRVDWICLEGAMRRIVLLQNGFSGQYPRSLM
jgi:hypothetical protein